MMGILDGAGLIKLEEHMITKAAQNKVYGLQLGQLIVVCKMIFKHTGSEMYRDGTDWLEDIQTNIGGRFHEDLKDVLKERRQEFESKTFGSEK